MQIMVSWLLNQLEAISELTNIPAFAIMSQECEKAIETYKDKVTILKMPKKGGIRIE
ncbi:MAG: hypothetical protein ACLTTH_10465 [Holdemanella porci]